MSGRIDRRVGWDRLPKALSLAVLVGLRDTLRRLNLHDTERGAVHQPAATRTAGAAAPRRSGPLDGTYNDLDQPRMGSAGTRFGRNIPFERDRARLAARTSCDRARARSAGR